MHNIDNIAFENARGEMNSLNSELSRSVYLSTPDREMLVAAVCLGSAVLLEGVPGTGKTTVAKATATAIGGTFGRIQGTPDLLPSDITGSEVYNRKTEEFNFRPGPLFNHVLLFDEINRAPTKSQAALLQAMQEHEVTVGTTTYDLPKPFIVLATENPMETGQGTQPLGKAPLDRFGISIELPIMTADDRKAVANISHEAKQVVDVRDIPEISKTILRLVSAEAPEVKNRALGIIDALSELSIVDMEDSVLGGYRPYAHILNFSKSLAAQEGTKDEHGNKVVEVKHVDQAADYVLRHRTSLTYDALNRGETVSQAIADAKAKAA